ncbi:MAG: peptidoglycan bridge formation glycyltransferase FemA/FemB family protein [Clostridia bacterium]|nr:peptidoglycan bridge formation glycyltransferase FemA/FemB family protein [Clostridia bacterium]
MELLDLNNAAAVAEYEAFNQNCPKGHFSQSVGWGKLKKEWKFAGIISRDAEGKINGIMSVLIRKMPMLPTSVLYAPRGPVCDVHDKAVLKTLLDGAKELAKQHKAYALKMDTDVKSDDLEYLGIMKDLGCKLPKDTKNFEGIQPRYVFRLYLEGRSDEEILMTFTQSHRRKVRLATRRGVTVKVADASALHDFYTIMLETGIRDNFVIRTEEYFRRLMECLGDAARLYMAYNAEGEAIAGTLAIGYGNKVWYLYGASSNSHRDLMPNYLLQYSMIQWAVERGADVYDFRGVSGDLSEDNPLYGLYRFKKDFNGEFTEFCGELNLVFDSTMMFLAEKGQKAYRKLNHVLFKLKNKK